MDPAGAPPPKRQWSTLALILTALGTFIGGLGTLLGVVYAGGDANPVAPRPTVTVTSVVTVTAKPTAGTPGTAPPATAGVRWRGDVLITPNRTDLDAVPVDNDAESGGDVTTGGHDGLSSFSSGSAVYPSRSDPGRAACAAWLRTHRQTLEDYESPPPGTRFCFRTDRGRVALLTVKKGGDSSEVTVTATVWN